MRKLSALGPPVRTAGSLVHVMQPFWITQFSCLHLGDNTTLPASRHGILAVDYLSSPPAAKSGEF